MSTNEMELMKIKQREKEAIKKDLAFKLLENGDAEVYGTFMVTLISQDELKGYLRYFAWFNPEFEKKLLKQLKSEKLTEWFNNEI